jgi:hypothetical protein
VEKISEFYGYLKGNKGEVTRCGSKNGGIKARLRSWRNDVQVHLGLVNGIDRLSIIMPISMPFILNGVMYRLVDGKPVEVQE